MAKSSTGAKSPIDKKVKKAPAFQLYTATWIASETIASLNLEEKGAYITLLVYDWENDGLTTDLDVLARLCSIQKRKFVKIWEKIADKFPFTEGRYRNSRLHEQRQETAAYRASQAEKANRRWSADICRGNAVALPTQCSLPVGTKDLKLAPSAPPQLPPPNYDDVSLTDVIGPVPSVDPSPIEVDVERIEKIKAFLADQPRPQPLYPTSEPDYAARTIGDRAAMSSEIGKALRNTKLRVMS